ncbi:MAG: PaaI family thioesterase [Gemmobacter sp.]|nr:PaaI family thioesterase [Gemmobacter sp.]
MTPKVETIAHQFLEALPHAKALSMTLVEISEGGRVVLSMPYDARLVGDPASGVLHGGAVYALLDTASGLASMLHAGSAGSTATLGMRVDYMRPATPGQRITAEAVCYNMTRTVAFVRATATDDDTTRPVATTNATFTNEPRRGARS